MFLLWFRVVLVYVVILRSKSTFSILLWCSSFLAIYICLIGAESRPIVISSVFFFVKKFIWCLVFVGSLIHDTEARWLQAEFYSNQLIISNSMDLSIVLIVALSKKLGSPCLSSALNCKS